jgi:hypothetical protein
MAGIGDYEGEGTFSMKNKNLASSAKYGTPMQKNYGSPPPKTGGTSFGDKLKAAGQTIVTHLDPDEKLGHMYSTYQLHKKKLREGKAKKEDSPANYKSPVKYERKKESKETEKPEYAQLNPSPRMKITRKDLRTGKESTTEEVKTKPITREEFFGN